MLEKIIGSLLKKFGNDKKFNFKPDYDLKIVVNLFILHNKNVSMDMNLKTTNKKWWGGSGNNKLIEHSFWFLQIWNKLCFCDCNKFNQDKWNDWSVNKYNEYHK